MNLDKGWANTLREGLAAARKQWAFLRQEPNVSTKELHDQLTATAALHDLARRLAEARIHGWKESWPPESDSLLAEARHAGLIE